MAKYVGSSEYSHKVYAPKMGKMSRVSVVRRPVPMVAGDELKLRLGIPDNYLVGSERLGGVVEHNPGYHGKKRKR